MKKTNEEKRCQEEDLLLELTYACISDVEKQKAVNAVRSYRDKKWEKALKSANNDFQKACELYDII